MPVNNQLELKYPCRLCAGKCDPDLVASSDNDNLTLFELVEKYICIKITVDDILPIQICETCKFKMTSFHEYAQKCINTQVILSTIIEVDGELNLDGNALKVETEDNKDIEQFIKLENFDDFSIKSEDDNDVFDDCDLSTIQRIQRRSSRASKSLKEKKHKKLTKKLKKKSVKLKILKSQITDSIEDIVSNTIKSEKKLSAINGSFLNFVCHVCQEDFEEWASLYKHTKGVHQTKPRVLCLCDKYLSNKTCIYKHIKKHSGTSLKCSVCDSTFLTEQRYHAHMQTHTSEPLPTYKCDQCDKTYNKTYLLRQHKKSHIPRELKYIYPCDLCEGKFVSKNAVRLHVRCVHDKEKPYVCDICGNKFSTKGNLKSHRFLHTGIRPYQCPHCPRSYKVNKNLKKHIDVHRGVVYKCSKCPSIFTYEKSLREHMNVHTDICRFVCGFCNKQFKWKRSFQCHLNLHTGETPYSCPWCPKTFADGANCRIHKRRKHPVEVAEDDANQIKQTVKRLNTSDESEIRSIPCNINIKPKVFPKLEHNTGSERDIIKIKIKANSDKDVKK